MADNRINKNRDTEERQATARPKTWSKPSVLPEPNPSAGWSFRWIRLSIRSEADATNFSSKTREGWEPCLAKDHPEIVLNTVESERFADNVVIGGLVLCKMADEMVAQREKHYADVRDSQLRAVNNDFMSQNDPAMPKFSEHKSKVSSFGTG